MFMQKKKRTWPVTLDKVYGILIHYVYTHTKHYGPCAQKS